MGDGCPFCDHPEEDTQHILTCQHNDALQIWSQALQVFTQKLEKFKTHPTLMTAIMNELVTWRYKLPEIPITHIHSEIRACIKDLRQMTVPTFLEGHIPRSMIKVQDEYFQQNEKHSPRGTTWAKKVYKACWALLKEIWIRRNEQLHETKRIEELQGLETIKLAIASEYRLGLHRLPACEFSIYFSSRLEQLLTRPIEQLRSWLLTIRMGRELHGGSNEIFDEFSSNGPMRAWLGLNKL